MVARGRVVLAFAFVLPLLSAASAAEPSAPLTAVTCSSPTGANVSLPYTVDVGGEVATGYYVYPAGTPKAIVAVGHGWLGDANGMRGILNNLATRGALAVAMDFRGDIQDYKIYTGAEDTAAAVRDLLAQCGDRTVILWGGSMGGHISSWTAMSNPGLADYLVMDVGPTNMPELLATAVPGFAVAGATGGLVTHQAAVSPRPCTGVPAFPDTNGCLLGAEAVPKIQEAYADRPATAPVDTSPALNATAWAASGLRWAYMVYGAADTIVTPDHGTQMLANLQAQGVAGTYYLATYRGVPSTASFEACAADPTPTAAECQGKGYAGIAPAGHVRSGDVIVRALLSQGAINDDPGFPVGLASPEHDPIGTNPVPALPGTGVPEVDGAADDADDAAEAAWAEVDRQAGPLYPAP